MNLRKTLGNWHERKKSKIKQKFLGIKTYFKLYLVAEISDFMGEKNIPLLIHL